MYTTLAELKANKACVPGYTRMIAFFGTAAALKDQRIPLHAVGLIGGYDDLMWAVENASQYDKEEYQKFRERTLVAAWHTKLEEVWSNFFFDSGSIRNSETAKNKVMFDHLRRAYSLVTNEQIEEFLEEMSLYRCENEIFHELITMWNKSASDYVRRVIELSLGTAAKINVSHHRMDSKDARTRHRLSLHYIINGFAVPSRFQIDWPELAVGQKSKVTKATSSWQEDDDEEEEDYDADIDRDPAPVRAGRRAVSVVAEEADGDTATAVASDATASDLVNDAATEVIKTITEVKPKNEFHTFGFTLQQIKKMTKAERASVVLLGNADHLFDFVTALKFKTPTGVKIKPKTNGQLTINIDTDARSTFFLLNTFSQMLAKKDEEE